MHADDTRPSCACGCGNPVKPGHRFLTGSHLSSRFTHEERFWLDVVRADGDACWGWLGLPDEEGYGRFMVNGQKIRAHRFSWTIHRGSIPEGIDVLHRCDNPPCTNPAHLFLGTHADNMRDASTKGRFASNGPGPRKAVGSRIGIAKLREADIPAIRALHGQGLSTREIGRRYGIAHHQVRRILNGTGWAHVK